MPFLGPVVNTWTLVLRICFGFIMLGMLGLGIWWSVFDHRQFLRVFGSPSNIGVIQPGDPVRFERTFCVRKSFGSDGLHVWYGRFLVRIEPPPERGHEALQIVLPRKDGNLVPGRDEPPIDADGYEVSNRRYGCTTIPLALPGGDTIGLPPGVWQFRARVFYWRNPAQQDPHEDLPPVTFTIPPTPNAPPALHQDDLP